MEWREVVPREREDNQERPREIIGSKRRERPPRLRQVKESLLGVRRESLETMTGAVSVKWWDRCQVKWAEKPKGCAPEEHVRTALWRSFAVRSAEVGLLLGKNEERRQKGDYEGGCQSTFLYCCEGLSGEEATSNTREAQPLKKPKPRERADHLGAHVEAWACGRNWDASYP